MRYEFGAFTIDPETYLLERNGKALSVEPRVLELLSYLVSNEGRVILKDELLSEVWNGQHVSESALNRCVHEARRAIDDKKRKYIVTVHGRGYRFDSRPEESSAVTKDSPRDLKTDDAGSLLPRRRRLALVAAIGAIAVVIALILLLRSRETTPGTAEGPPSGVTPPSSIRVALLPMSIDETDDNLRLTGLMMTELLMSKLSRIDRLIVRPPDYTASILEEQGSLSKVAEHAKVSHVIGTSMSAEKDVVRLDVDLHAFPEGGRSTTTPIGSFQIPIDLASTASGLDAFVRTRDAIVVELIGRLTPALALPAGDPLVPDNPEAFRLYLIALDRLETSFCDGGGSYELLTRALELDPEFINGWQLLAVVQYNQVWACGTGSESYERARESAARASALAPDLASPQLIEVLILVETSQAEDAYERLLSIRKKHPNNPEAIASHAYVLRYAGYLEEAERRLREVLAVDPLQLAADPAGNVPNSLLYQGKIDEYLELLPATDSPYHRFYRGFAEMLKGENQKAIDVLEPAFRSNPADLFARFSQCLLAILEGDLESANAIVHEISRQRRALNTSDGEVTYKQAQLFALAGDLAAASRDLRLAVDQGFFCSDCFRRDPTLAPLRGRPDYEETVAAADARHRAFGKRFGLKTSSAAE